MSHLNSNPSLARDLSLNGALIKVKVMSIELSLYVILLITQISILVGLVLILFSNISSNNHGAPYVPIKKKLIKGLLLFGELSADDNFYDLGAGDGRVLLTATEDFNVSKLVGYEVSLWPYLKSRFLFRNLRPDKTIEVYRQDFFKANLSGGTFIYVYLFPKLVDRLAPKLAAELKPSVKILCPSFGIDLVRHPQFQLLKSGKIGKITAYLYEKI